MSTSILLPVANNVVNQESVQTVDMRNVWIVKYVAGNPAMYKKVRQTDPMTRSKAIELTKEFHPKWRVWVQRVDSNERIYETEIEKEWLD